MLAAVFNNRPLDPSGTDSELYVDPDDLVADLVRDAAEDGLNVVIAGPRRSGKTSLLSALTYAIRHWPDPLVVNVAGRGLASVEDLVGRVADGIQDQHPPTLRKPGRVDLLSVIADAVPDGARVLVLLDEPSREIAFQLFGRLRDELWRLPVTWVVAVAPHDFGAFITPPADGFFERIIELGSLPSDRARAVLERRLARAPEYRERLEPFLDDIVAAAAGRPQLLLSLARDVIAGGSVTSSARALEARERRLTEVSPSARKLFAVLDAWGAGSAADAELQGEVGVSAPRLTQLLKELERVALVHSTAGPGRGGRPRTVYVPARPEEIATT
ncbi:MAG: hypothetical protein WKF94_17920 [Solirubrobacteraceae bacterium]